MNEKQTTEMIGVATDKQPHKKCQISTSMFPCLEMEAVSRYSSRDDMYVYFVCDKPIAFEKVFLPTYTILLYDNFFLVST